MLLYVLLLFIEENLSFTIYRHLMSEDYCAFKAAQRSCGGRERGREGTIEREGRREGTIEREGRREVLFLSGWTVHGTVKPL